MRQTDGMTGRGLTSLHFIPQGQTVRAEYNITKILEKEESLFSAVDLQQKSLYNKSFHEQKQCDIRTR